jgi:hypothetical protein
MVRNQVVVPSIELKKGRLATAKLRPLPIKIPITFT